MPLALLIRSDGRNGGPNSRRPKVRAAAVPEAWRSRSASTRASRAHRRQIHIDAIGIGDEGRVHRPDKPNGALKDHMRREIRRFDAPARQTN
jgi:hypothetical protein